MWPAARIRAMLRPSHRRSGCATETCAARSTQKTLFARLQWHLQRRELVWVVRCTGGGASCALAMIFSVLYAYMQVRQKGLALSWVCHPLHSTHRGARTHDHKVKGLALCRLS